MNLYQKEEIKTFLDKFESRRTQVSDEIDNAVTVILKNIRTRKDAALLEYTEKFDNVDLSAMGIKVPLDVLKKAHANLDPQLLEVIRESRDNIKRFHSKGLPQSWMSWEEDGVVLGQRVMPLERVGIYVPGGRAAYPSSMLMGVVPAQVAGVKEIIVTTPADKDGNVNPTILAAAYELGITRVFRVGGAQAIAAMAFGTATIPRVDKIVGPGNIYVATAKKMLYGQIGIDMVAGPSEVVVLADSTANAEYVAADLLAQAEHDPLASSIVITDSETLANNVIEQVEKQTNLLERSEIIDSSLNDYGAVILADSMQECIEISNRLAPEHLGLHVENAWEAVENITNAGAIFLGSYSPEAVGDYWAGPNHVLPTNGSARFFSPLRTEDFLKTSSIIHYSQKAIQKHGNKIIKFANSEALTAHAQSIYRRMDK